MPEEQTELGERYEVENTAQWIVGRGWTRVALQFPDGMLGDAAAVGRALQAALPSGVQLFVCADTTFASCCVDEVAAAHANADAVVHYGPACLSPVSRLPVRFVFGRQPLSPAAAATAAQRIHAHAASLASSSSPVHALLLLFDLEYAHAMPKLQMALDEAATPGTTAMPIIVARVAATEFEPCTDAVGASAAATSTSLGGLVWVLPDGVVMEDCALVWVGHEGVALTNTLMRFPTTCCALWQPSDARWTEDVASIGRVVKRRYFLVQKAKDANIVGILVGTLGVAGYRSAIERLRTLVRGAGKRCYVMSMGRVAPAKLANFPEVDVFVLVACAQTALVDSKEYYAPVITPFEAELAFCDKPWPGHLRLDFNTLTEGDVAHTPSVAATEPRFSLLTGRLTGGAGTGNCDADGGAAAAEEQEEEAAHGHKTRREGASRELAVRAQRALAVASSGAPAEATSGAEFLVLRRSYQGMEAGAADRQHAEPVLLAVPGQTGRAATYQHEG